MIGDRIIVACEAGTSLTIMVKAAIEAWMDGVTTVQVVSSPGFLHSTAGFLGLNM